MSIYLIRHAHAGAPGSVRNDVERPLTDLGWTQANALVEQLADRGPSLLVSSPYLRCRQTLEPLGEAIGRPVETTPVLAEQAPTGAADLVRSLIDTDAVLCTHSDVIPRVLQSLAWEDGIDMPACHAPDYAQVWELSVEDGAFVSAEPFARV